MATVQWGYLNTLTFCNFPSFLLHPALPQRSPLGLRSLPSKFFVIFIVSHRIALLLAFNVTIR